MNLILLVAFFFLILALGWIFFDDNDWNGGGRR